MLLLAGLFVREISRTRSVKPGRAWTGGRRGTPGGMTEPIHLGETADKSIDESVQEERDVVGDAPDTGGLVPPVSGAQAGSPAD